MKLLTLWVLASPYSTLWDSARQILVRCKRAKLIFRLKHFHGYTLNVELQGMLAKVNEAIKIVQGYLSYNESIVHKNTFCEVKSYILKGTFILVRDATLLI